MYRGSASLGRNGNVKGNPRGTPTERGNPPVFNMNTPERDDGGERGKGSPDNPQHGFQQPPAWFLQWANSHGEQTNGLIAQLNHRVGALQAEVEHRLEQTSKSLMEQQRELEGIRKLTEHRDHQDEANKQRGRESAPPFDGTNPEGRRQNARHPRNFAKPPEHGCGG